MQAKRITLNNRGMSRDMSVSKASNEFAWENFNVRITARDNDNLLSVTNERGTKTAMPLPAGTILGWNTLGYNLILFIKNTTSQPDRIYVVYYSKPTDSFLYRSRYYGYLGFSEDNPIESVVSYESEDVQKIYWVDGKHVMRSCNFMSEHENYYSSVEDTRFDSTKGITSGISVTTEKDNGGSTRPNGTMQYFVSAYDKLGVETAIVAESTLVYLSPMDRGGAADEVNNNRVIIKISGTANCGLDYIRVYGVMRTSQNGTPQAYIISEVPVAPDSTKPLEVVDNGANYISSVDPSVLLFLGSKEVVASTIEQKDNTLFLGNLEVKSNDYDDLDTWARGYVGNGGISTSLTFTANKLIKLPPATSSYPYRSQLNEESNVSKIFKANEKYRFAVVFRKANGDRSKAFWIGDKECTTYPNMKANAGYVTCSMPTVSITTTTAKSLGYEYAQLYMAQATYADRSVQAQGFLNPTVFNLYDRYNNQPYSMPSWIARPMLGNVEFMHYSSLANTSTKQAELQSNSWNANRPKAFYGKTSGGVINTYVPEAWEGRPQNAEELDGYTGVAFYMMWDYKKTSSNFKVRRAGVMIYVTTESPLPTLSPYNTGGDGWTYLRDVVYCSALDYTYNWVEFTSAVHKISEEDPILHLYYDPSDPTLESLRNNQPQQTTGSMIVVDSEPVEVEGVITDLNSAGLFCLYSRQHYFVDSNIVTFHSPEIEYGQVNLDNDSAIRLRIVGAAQISSSITDSNMQVSDSDLVGNNIVKYNYSTPNLATSIGTLTAAPMYYDSIVNGSLDETKALSPAKAFYMTYMWHKSGSMINYSDGSGRTYATLKTKRFANMQYAYYSHYTSTTTLYIPKSIRQITGYSSGLYEIDTVDGVKSYAVNTPTTVLTPPSYKYPIYRSSKASSTYDEAMTLSYSTLADSPVTIAYNTRPHIVLSLSSSSSSSSISSMTILPKRAGSSGGDEWDMREDFIVNYVPVLEKIDSVSGIGRVYLQINNDARTGETDLYSALRSTLSIVDNGYLLVNVAIRERNGQVVHTLDSSEFTYNSITLSSGHSTWNAVGNILALTFTVTRNGVSDNGVYLYRNAVPVNVYGTASYTYIGWSDTKQFSSSSVAPQVSLTMSTFTDASAPYLWLGELYKDFSQNDTRYGGTSESAVQNNIFIPCGPEVQMTGSTVTLTGDEGDTYFQRYDCIVSYPQSENDVNQSLDIASVMLETHINLDGRTDKDRGVGQLADIDYTQFGVINPVYNQENNFFQARVFDEKYNQGVYPTTITWSKEKHPLETNDTWVNVNLASTYTMDPTHGPLNSINKFRNSLIAFQDSAVSEIMFNSRVQLATTDGVPVEIANSGKVDGTRIISNHYGCLNKWSIVEGKNGLYFKDDNSKVIAALANNNIEPISTKSGLDAWVRNNSSLSVWTPSSFSNTVSFYDNEASDVYFVNNSESDYPCLVFNETLGTFTGFFSYGSVPVMTNIGRRFVSLYGGSLWLMNGGQYNNIFGVSVPSYVLYRVAPDPISDKIWTNIEYRADTLRVLNSSSAEILDEGGTGVDTFGSTAYQIDDTFNSIKMWNEYQTTGEISSAFSSDEQPTQDYLTKRFRIWRAIIPRATSNGRDRIRNPWVWLKMQKDDIAGTDQLQLHNVTITYFE